MGFIPNRDRKGAANPNRNRKGAANPNRDRLPFTSRSDVKGKGAGRRPYLGNTG